MDVLVLETGQDRAHLVAGKFVADGHRVWRCHAPGDGPFPCRALTGEGCPLEDPGIDVVITARAPHAVDPSVYEDGVACALRARVPLVVLTDHGENPFGEYTAAVVDDDAQVTEECERILAQPSPHHSAVATGTLRSALSRHAGTASAMAAAAVYRTRLGLKVRLDGVDELDACGRGLVVTQVVAAVRAFDRSAPAIDVSSKRRDEASVTS